MTDSLFSTPRVTPFVECPNCKRLIEYGLTACPSCREEINPDYALASAAVVMVNTQACSRANTIKTAEMGALVVFCASLLGFLLRDSSLLIVNLLTPIISLAAVLIWFRSYRRFRIGDDEFVKAKARMRKSLKLWTTLLVVQLLALTYMFRSGF
jgi:hypothetical protein